MTYITQARINEIARETRRELIAKGYGRVSLENLKLHVISIMNAIELTACYEDNRRAYDAIHDTAYYADNGPAYLAAQDIIFAQRDIDKLHHEAQERRRALMIEAGTWTEQHEYWYTRINAA